MNDATSRLRRTFAYPSDDSTDPANSDHLDEQQQESLISSFQSKARADDILYTRILTLVSLASILPFLLYLTTFPLLALLSIASLGTTAYITALVPPEATVNTPTNAANSWKSWLPLRLPEQKHKWYSSQGLAWLNLVLSIMVVIPSLGYRSERLFGDGVFGWLLILPALVFAVVGVVRGSMVSVQRGVGELRGLRYGLKGA